MKRAVLLNLLVSAGALLLCFAAAEIAVRYGGDYDEYGNFVFNEQALRPYHLPVAATKDKVEKYTALSATTPATLPLLYDAELGWSPRPNSRSDDGNYSYNSVGIRSAPTEYTLKPPEETLRIALFGDSFTHGDEVPFENTWGYSLERKLKQAGINAEVINFGVFGYGMDQAYLRWHTLGRQYSPDIVIFGLQMENVLRNVNVIRPVSSRGTGIPFSKPRFVLNGHALNLINVPTLAPQAVPAVMENMEAWELVEHEYFYNPQNFQDRFWLKSKLIALASKAVLSERDNLSTRDYYFDRKTWDISQEPGRLTLHIIDKFRDDVDAHGAKFLLVHLPLRRDIDELLSGREFVYAELLSKIDEKNDMIYPERTMLREVIELNLVSVEALFTREAGGHYSALGNDVIAAAVADYLMANVLNE